MIDGVEWVFIDTAPTMWVVVQEPIRAATLVVIPARPGFFDLAAVTETVKIARERQKPYAVVINAAPVKRDERESPTVAASRGRLEALGIPVWSGQISQRAGYMASLAAPRPIPPPARRSRGCGRRSSARSRRSAARSRPTAHGRCTAGPRNGTRSPDAVQRAAVHRRSGVQDFSIEMGPGSPAHRSALRCARDTRTGVRRARPARACVTTWQFRAALR